MGHSTHSSFAEQLYAHWIGCSYQEIHKPLWLLESSLANDRLLACEEDIRKSRRKNNFETVRR